MGVAADHEGHAAADVESAARGDGNTEGGGSAARGCGADRVPHDGGGGLSSLRGAHIVKNGSMEGSQRYKCRGRSKSFNALAGTPMARLRLRGKWPAYAKALCDGLTLRDAAIRPDTIHGDTQAQSYTVFALSHLLGIKLMPRIRGIKDLVFHRPDSNKKFTHIDRLFSDDINWQMIETHLPDMLRVAVSIKLGKISATDILRRLGTNSRKNKLYFAFKELGKVIRTMFLLANKTSLFPLLRLHRKQIHLTCSAQKKAISKDGLRRTISSNTYVLTDKNKAVTDSFIGHFFAEV